MFATCERHVDDAHEIALLDGSIREFVDLHESLRAAVGPDRQQHSTADCQLIDQLDKQRMLED